MQDIETTISITITGLIRDYCSNFLSYLYLQHGWKRTMFEMSKEIVISNNIRIIITHTGTIMLTCYSMADILTAIEFIVNEFEYGRMKNYLVYDEKVTIKTDYTTNIPLHEYFYEEPEDLISKHGTCYIHKDLVTLKYDSYEAGYFLISKIRDVFFSPEDSYDSTIPHDEITQSSQSSPNTENAQSIQRTQNYQNSISIYRQCNIPSELFIFSALLSWSIAQIFEYL